MRNIRIVWSDLARTDLRELRRRIAEDSPKRARDYIRRPREATNRLRRFPESGWIVEEINEPDIREIVYDMYRLIYRYRKVVEMLRVWPAARPLDRDRLESD